MIKERYKTLDYLRGIMAISIMFFHCCLDFYHEPDANEIIGRIGLYGVSIFFVLSGLTLFMVYNNTKNFNLQFLLGFGVKRIFRIYPVLWLTIFLTVILKDRHLSEWKWILNLSGLFGFHPPRNWIARGQWSLGNELVFYAFFPIFLFLAKKHVKLFLIVFIGSLAAGIYFAFFVLNTTGTLHKDHWMEYINPFNQLLLFSGGIMIGYLYQNGYLEGLKRYAKLFLMVSILLFIFYPIGNVDRIYLVTGLARLLFVFLSYCICMFTFISEFKLNHVVEKILSKLGEASYSLYLLHPVVFLVVVKSNENYLHLSHVGVIALGGCFAIIFSYLTYITLEKTFMRYGKVLSDKFSKINFIPEK